MSRLRIGRVINNAKKNYVKSLTNKIYGDNWTEDESLEWYKNMLINTDDYGDVGEDEEREECDCLSFECSLRV